MKHWVEEQENLTLRQEMVEALVLEALRRIRPACDAASHWAWWHAAIRSTRADAVILTTGTFLKALMHTGEAKTRGGRAGDQSAER